MANIKSAMKRAKISKVKHARNISAKSTIKTHIRNMETAAAEGNTERATELYTTVTSLLDKAASKGIIHKNKAARTKSRLAAKI